jgi:HPt (histidine-containing phosphotransfer) domain-containing protein
MRMLDVFKFLGITPFKRAIVQGLRRTLAPQARQIVVSENLVYDLPPGVRQQLQAMFLAHCTKQFTALHDAYRDNNLQAMAAQAHSLGGASHQVHAPTLAALCSQIEKRCDAGELTAIETLLASAASEFEILRRTWHNSGTDEAVSS